MDFRLSERIRTGTSTLDANITNRRLHASHENISEYNQKSEKWKEIIKYSSQLKAMSAEFNKLDDALKPEFNRYLNATPSDQTV